jgi:hypothetical protein
LSRGSTGSIQADALANGQARQCSNLTVSLRRKHAVVYMFTGTLGQRTLLDIYIDSSTCGRHNRPLHMFLSFVWVGDGASFQGLPHAHVTTHMLCACPGGSPARIWIILLHTCNPAHLPSTLFLPSVSYKTGSALVAVKVTRGAPDRPDVADCCPFWAAGRCRRIGTAVSWQKLRVVV